MRSGLVSKGWELGLLQGSIPAAYGGFGERSALTGVLAGEELAFGDLAGAFAIGAPGLFALPILLAGSEAQRQEFLGPVTGAGWRPYTAALIEYVFDFDPNALGSTATRVGQEYLLNGEKALVPYAAGAEAILVYASLNGQTQGFIVPKGTEGLEILDQREQRFHRRRAGTPRP